MILHRLTLLAVTLTAFSPCAAVAQRPRDPATLTIALAREPLSPIPTLWRNDITNIDVSDLMFLRLADLGPEVTTIGEKGFVPRLARQWTRRDPVTLAFDLDPRAHWQDGKPVTAADVVLGFERARNPKLTPQIATLLRRIKDVKAEGASRVVVTFTEPYPEQLYDATYQAPPLPAHLLAGIPAESLGTSSFAAAPVGSGPYRFVRRVPGQLLELAADSTFFLGRPKVTRVIFLLASNPEARANLLLDGTADAVDNIYSFTNPARLQRLPAFQYYPVPGLLLAYIGINARDPADTSRPHPILSDPVVRQALVLGIDRKVISQAQYGPLTTSPAAPVSPVLRRNLDAPSPLPYDPARAAKLLEGAGWTDHDGDGIRDKNGTPLRLKMIVPSPVPARVVMGTRAQEAYRKLGIDLVLEIEEGGVYTTRRNAGQFDLDFAGVRQDPTPSGLTQSWTCAGIGGSNVIHYCNPAVDTLIRRASVSLTGAPALYRQALQRIADDHPAIFMAAVVGTFAVNRRFENVRIPPTSPWSAVWQWGVKR